jgi:(heptosyl)LPS beta-1,4-glucosyltransferase
MHMHNAERLAVSVAIVAKDEADRIAACIDSLRFADEVVVVVDDRSTDNTLEIAQSRGCRTISKAWMGYANQKQFAVDACQHDWVLIMDADERVPGQTAESITRLLSTSDALAPAYGFLRKNIFHGRWFKRCGWWPDRVVRLVNRKKGRFSKNIVHEQWLPDEPPIRLDGIIEHYSFRSYADLIQKMQVYSSLAATQMEKEGRHSTWWSPISHGAWTFIRSYLFELGMLEGFDGFVISMTNAGGSFMKYAKLRERRLCRLSCEE